MAKTNYASFTVLQKMQTTMYYSLVSRSSKQDVMSVTTWSKCSRIY